MRSKQQIIEQLLNPGVVAVVRAKRAEQAVPLAEALVAGGVIALVLEDDATSTAVAPWLGPDGGGLAGAVRF